MSYRLVVTEKPSVAQSIAKVLKVRNRKEGYLEGNGYFITWCVGHLVGLADAKEYDEKYEKWDLKDTPDPPRSMETGSKFRKTQTIPHSQSPYEPLGCGCHHLCDRRRT